MEPINEYASENNTHFSIKDKGLKLNTDKDVEPFVTAIGDMDDLTTISFSGNTIGVDAAKALATALKSRSKLKQAFLSDIFTGRLVDEIPDALKALCDAFENVELELLDLSDNAFGPAGAKPLIGFLSKAKHLKKLYLNNNGLGIEGGTIIAKALMASAEAAKADNRKSALREIVCGRNRLEDGSSKALAEAFAAHGTLEIVRMRQNGIRPNGIKNIVGGLKECKELKRLDFEDNTITLKGSNALARALQSWPELEELNLNDCLLKRMGGVALLEALRDSKKDTSKKLKELHLQYNELQSDSIDALADAVKNHLKDLEKVNLNGNRFKEGDEEELLKALEFHGHGDALDELDDLEEDWDEEEEEEEEEEDEEEPQVVQDADEAQESEPLAKEENDTKTKEESDELMEKMKKLNL